MTINALPIAGPKTRAYAVALGVTLVALFLRWLLVPVLGNSTPFVLLAIMISAWHGGLGPGLMATAVSTVFITIFPQLTASDPLPGSRVPITLSILILGILISFLQESLHRAHRHLEHRTRELSDSNKQLSASNENFSLLVQSVRDYGIFMLDPQGHIATWNSGAEYIKGYTAEEILGQHFSKFYPPEDIANDKPGMELRVAAAEGRFEDLGWRLRKDGSRFWANVVITAVRDSTGTLRGFSKVTRDLTERKIAEENNRLLMQEQAARAEAEAANRAKDQFLSVLSHELRTPLNAILGWASMLQKRRLDPEMETQAVESIQRSAKIQAMLVEDLIDVSRMISGKFSIETRPMPLGPTIDAAVNKMLPLAGDKRINLQVQKSQRTGEVLGDSLRIEQVVLNLLSNAIKFTPAGGTVTLQLLQDDSHARIIVSDTGQGIPADVLPLVFERFRQADSSSTRGHGGLGLGLAIVRYVVEAHGGTVAAASPGKGKGATFTVELPLLKEQPLLADGHSKNRELAMQSS